METGSQLHQAGPVVVLAGQTGEYTPFNADSRQIFPDVTLQDGMGADLDENTESKLAQLLDGGGEVHRLTDISPPVLLVKAAAPLLSSADGGDEKDIRVPGRLKSMELLGKILPNGLHVPTVKRIFQGQRTEKDAFLLHLLAETGQGFTAAGEGDVARRIDPRDF